MDFKRYIRNLLNVLYCDLTKNIEYDRLTKKIIKQILKLNSNCIDVGCHKGEILDYFIKYAPNGKHFGFEPIPSFYNRLKEDYCNKATIFPYAVSSQNGQSSFMYIKNAPAYSGIRKRKYSVKHPEIEKIDVELRTLDEVIQDNIQIDLIKIDVEGGEFDVLKGAKQILVKYKPKVIFEFGLGASEFYGTTPLELYNYITLEIGMNISTLKSYFTQKPLSLSEITIIKRNTTLLPISKEAGKLPTSSNYYPFIFSAIFKANVSNCNSLSSDGLP